jgi:hypothetical protein
MYERLYLIASVVALVTSYAAFVEKEAVLWAALVAFTSSGVLAYGSLSLTATSGGSEFTYSSEPMAVLWTLNALVAILVVAAAVTGQYDATSGVDAGMDQSDITDGYEQP